MVEMNWTNHMRSMKFNKIITKKLNQDQKKKVKTDFDYSSNCCPKNNKKKLKH